MAPTSHELTHDFLRQLAARDGAVWVREASASMGPLLEAGDELCLAPARAPLAGAIVAYDAGSRLVVHRVMRRVSRGLLTKGDALRGRDPVVPAERVIGVLVAVRTVSGRSLDVTSPGWRAVGRLIAGVDRWLRPARLRWAITRAVCHAAARGRR